MKTEFAPRKALLSAILATVFSTGAWAVDPFTIRDIRLEGLQRTEAGTVFSYLPVKVGDQFNDERATESIRSLFATGFFKDVRIDVDGDVLVVVVEERPAIANVDITGMKEFDVENVKKTLKEVGLAEARIFDRSILERAEQELKRQYLGRGRYNVKVTTTVTPLERNRVGIAVAIDEGEVSKIREIRIVGASKFSEGELLKQFQQTTGGWFTWYTKTDQYSKQKLTGDLETLRSYYLNRGYLEFNVESTQVSISPDKQDIFVTINITEGEQYKVSSVKLAGEMLGIEDDLRKFVAVRQGETFSALAVNASTKALTDKLGTLGYAFANINAVPELDREKREVALTFYVDPVRRVYVRRINVVGNTRTRDEVVRREMRQMESAWYDGGRIQLGKERVERTGYFQDVKVETPAVPGTSDQVDVNVEVKEKQTGQIQASVGYSQADGLTIGTSLSQSNLFGSGLTVAFDLNTSRVNRTLSVSQTNPYATIDGISRTTSLYYRTNRPLTINSGNFRSISAGGGLTYGVPFNEYDTVFFGMNAEALTLDLDTSSPLRYFDYVNAYGRRTYSVLGTVGWGRDNRDSAFTPTRGTYQRANLEFTVPGSKVKYVRASYQYQKYIPAPIFPRLTLAFNGQLDYGRGLGDKPFPVFKNLYGGGIGSVRGFDSGALGPRDVNGDYLGGPTRVVGNVELIFPVPGSAQATDKTLRLFTFLDAGQVYGDRQRINLRELRYSAGIGFSWVSPVGPLKLSLGFPLNDKPGDKLQRFQFQVGTSF